MPININITLSTTFAVSETSLLFTDAIQMPPLCCWDGTEILSGAADVLLAGLATPRLCACVLAPTNSKLIYPGCWGPLENPGKCTSLCCSPTGHPCSSQPTSVSTTVTWQYPGQRSLLGPSNPHSNSILPLAWVRPSIQVLTSMAGAGGAAFLF